MSDLDRLSRLLAESSDPNNPSPETLASLISRLSTLAVVGVSRDPQKPARRVPSYLAAKGLEIIPVNPNASWILGRRARPTLAAVSEAVDLVLLFRPSEEAGVLVREGGERPERPALWLQEGIRDNAAASEARSSGRTVVQDLCLFKAHRCLRENRPDPIIPRVRAGESSGGRGTGPRR
ncbi:MAG: CoA-binding protein [Gemmatimonadales bacterium]|nr:MAG: CoA-binding protein [Gemmatimonadales bacterium]